MTRSEAQEQIVGVLLEKIRGDRYPSATQMSMVEQILPRHMVSDYLEILMDKVSQDTWPSIAMLRRAQRIAESLPVRELQRGDGDGDGDE